jgi:hypothetical protein
VSFKCTNSSGSAIHRRTTCHSDVPIQVEVEFSGEERVIQVYQSKWMCNSVESRVPFKCTNSSGSVIHWRTSCHSSV